jgi:Tfp pilus assembly protein PilF
VPILAPVSDRAIAPLRARHADALAEVPMELAADLMLARASARAEVHDVALEVLRRGLETLPDNRDLLFRLGEQLGIQGDLEGAAKAFRASCQPGAAGGRSHTDAALGWAEVAALGADRT